MKILAIAASNSLQSINKKLLTHVATLLAPLDVELIDINKYEVPIYSIDKEIEKSIGLQNEVNKYLSFDMSFG